MEGVGGLVLMFKCGHVVVSALLVGDAEVLLRNWAAAECDGVWATCVLDACPSTLRCDTNAKLMLAYAFAHDPKPLRRALVAAAAMLLHRGLPVHVRRPAGGPEGERVPASVQFPLWPVAYEAWRGCTMNNRDMMQVVVLPRGGWCPPRPLVEMVKEFGHQAHGAAWGHVSQLSIEFVGATGELLVREPPVAPGRFTPQMREVARATFPLERIAKWGAADDRTLYRWSLSSFQEISMAMLFATHVLWSSANVASGRSVACAEHRAGLLDEMLEARAQACRDIHASW
jgi:hypothetical protein